MVNGHGQVIVTEVPLVEKPVGDVEVCNDNKEVENLTADKTSQVDSIPTKYNDVKIDRDKTHTLLFANPLLKIFDKSVFSLFHIINISTPSSFSKIFHQPTLKMQPENPEKEFYFICWQNMHILISILTFVLTHEFLSCLHTKNFHNLMRLTQHFAQ